MPQLYKSGIHYYKCGMDLFELHDENLFQYDLISPSNDNANLMSCMDDINARYGRSTVQMTVKRFERKSAMRRELLSLQDTTKRSDIPKIIC